MQVLHEWLSVSVQKEGSGLDGKRVNKTAVSGGKKSSVVVVGVSC